MIATLRHAGILVENITLAINTYKKLGFRSKGPPEVLIVQKMEDCTGNVIELVKGNWHPHIAVNWYEGPDGNYIEAVEDKS